MTGMLQSHSDLFALVRARQVAVFCGAGISRNSGLPLAAHIVSAFLDAVNATPEERRAVIDAELPFELFMQSLDEHRSVRPVFDTFSQARPNTNHFFLAHLMSAGYVSDVFTTNFDCLIEDAVASQDYDLLDDDQSFERTAWQTARRRIVKIHGSLAKYENMAFTLRQVASGKLAERRGKALDYLFRDGPHFAVMVLGYSGSDRFDISPRLESYQANGKTVIVLDHGVQAAPQPLSAKPQPNPFAQFPGIRLTADTDAFVRQLWETVLPVPHAAIRSPAIESWRDAIVEWGRAASTAAEREAILAHLMFAAGRPMLGLQRIGDDHASGDQFRRALQLMNSGAGLGASGRYEKAVEVLEAAREMAGPLGNDALTGQIVANLAHATFEMGHIRKALELCVSASAWLGNDADRTVGGLLDTMAACFDRLGLHDDAVRCGTQARDMMRDLGEQAFFGVTTGNMALYLEHVGRKSEALRLHCEAYGISAGIDAASVARHAGNIIRLATELGDTATAEEYRRRLDERADEETLDDRAARIHNQANELNRSGRAREALPLYDEAIGLSRQSGNVAGLALQLYNRGLAHYRETRLQYAADDFVDAENAAREIADHHIIVNATVMLSKVLLECGQLEDALGHLEDVLDLMREAGSVGDNEPDEIEGLVRRLRKDLGSDLSG
jgi:tetratricopeptide (TPR) repeat protein